MSDPVDVVEDRALGAMLGLAIGDALGMPTQLLSRAHILEDYGEIRGLVAAGPRQVIAAGMPAGAVTDDTRQALLLARLLIEDDGRIDATVWARALGIAVPARPRTRLVDAVVDASMVTHNTSIGLSAAAAVGAIAGARCGARGWPADAVRRVSDVNEIDLVGVSADLVRLRRR